MPKSSSIATQRLKHRRAKNWATPKDRPLLGLGLLIEGKSPLAKN